VAPKARILSVRVILDDQEPGLGPAQVVQAIVSSAQRRSAGGYSLAVGFGEVDAAAALTAAGPPGGGPG
jgi:hypothetical protein